MIHGTAEIEFLKSHDREVKQTESGGGPVFLFWIWADFRGFSFFLGSIVSMELTWLIGTRHFYSLRGEIISRVGSRET